MAKILERIESRQESMASDITHLKDSSNEIK